MDLASIPRHPRLPVERLKHHQTMKTLRAFAIWTVIGFCFLWALVGCSYSVEPDGATTISLDGAQALRAIEIFATK
jgi:hypothetical protein